MSGRDEAIQQAMENIGQGVKRAIRRSLTIEPEPSPLPPPDSPLYELNLLLHRIIARQRGRPCPCGCCNE